MKDVILTGIRSNEEPTLGNYLGAFLPMAELQQDMVINSQYQLNMFVPDLHSFTTPVNHQTLYTNTQRNLKYFVAAGLELDNSDTYIYRQSYISAHSELAVILNNFAYFGELSRMTQFKEKGSADNSVSMGLLDYPVLMAADILLYGAKYVPVGDDQRQHLELTRDLAIRMNNKFGELFAVPEEWGKQLEFAKRHEGVRVRSLRRPENKMSKSVDDPAGTILLSDGPAEAKAKIMSATTDNEGQINWDWDKQPGVTNLLLILQLLTGADKDEIATTWNGKSSYNDLKTAAAEATATFLEGFQSRLNQVDAGQLDAKLQDSESKMTQVAGKKLEQVQTAVGLRP